MPFLIAWSLRVASREHGLPSTGDYGLHPTDDVIGRPDPVEDHPTTRSDEMNWDRIEGNWKQFKGNVKQQWGKLTDDQLDVIAGRRDELAGRIQESYGISKDEAEKQIADWEARQKD